MSAPPARDARLHVLVLAGGGGTRLWPLSRRRRPKQFLTEFGGTALITQTWNRVSAIVPKERLWVVAGRTHEPVIRELLPDLAPPHFVREPAAKNTAPAIGLACAAIAAEDPDAVVAVLSSDHAIHRPDRFRDLLRAAAALAAERGKLVTLGIVPDRPATGYGYIEKGASLGPVREAEAFGVARFVEKPDVTRATEFLRSGNYLWNSGMFVWRAADLLAEIDAFLPELGKGLKEYAAAPAGTRDEVAARIFATTTPISIDYAVMEKSNRVAVIPADIGWDDIGTFRSLAEVNPDGQGGSATAREVVAVDARANLIHAPGKTVALIGVDDLIVVDTPDALLVARRDRAEDVKKIVDALAAKKRDDIL